MKKIIQTAAVLAIIASAGCYETDQEYFINPDGSGKVVFEAKFQGGMMNMMGDDDADPKEKSKQAAAGIVSDSEGIETWKDVSYKLLEDGRTYFKGTGYFKNVAKVEFENLGDARIALKKTTKGSLVLDVVLGDKDDDEEDDDAVATPKLTEEQIKAKITAQRMKFTQSKAMMTGFLGTMKTKMTFHMPGTLKGGSNLKKTKEGALRLSFTGTDMVKAMEELVADDDFMREMIVAGKDVSKDGPDDDLALNEKLFGKKGPIRAVYSAPHKPLFGYKAEVAAAKKAFGKIAKELETAPPAGAIETLQGEPIEGTRIAGVRLIRFVDKKNGIRPFNQDAGYSLILVAAMPESVFGIEGGKVTQAVSDTGQDLLPKKDWDRKISWPKLSEDKKAAILEVKLKVPDENAKGLKILAGEVTYLVASGTKEVNLGITEFAVDTVGTECGAKIKKLGKASWGEGFTMDVKFALSKNAIKEVKFYDQAGTQLTVESAGSSWGGNNTTLTFRSKTGFPEKGKIVVELYDNQKKVIVPFKLENISLLGGALK